MDLDADLVAARALRRATQRLSRRLQAQRSADGLSLTKISMLGHLARKGPMPAGALAEADRLQPQSVTRVLAELESAGLVTRSQNPADRRQRVFSISAAGIDSLAEDMREREEWLAGVLRRSLTDLEREAVMFAAGILERLADA